MNVVEHRSLWSAIQQFPLDEPNAAITFSKKLAAEQNWSTAFTQEAIEEYRKFIFLCCIAPKGASPSKIVDEVWHLHLTYTQSYWIKLCKETLGKDIHHHPSRGGEEEDHKHVNWYRETLQLYQQVFGSPPPKQIWPPPLDESPPRITFLRNKTPDLLRILFVVILSIPLVSIGLLYFNFNPFSLTGSQFLVFFRILAVCCIACFLLLQYEKSHAIKDLVDQHFPSDATVYQLAQFLYGKHRAIQTAIVDLVRRKLLEPTEYKLFTVSKNNPIPFDNPLLEGFLKETETVVSYDQIAVNWYNPESLAHPSLEYLYEWAYRKRSVLVRFHFLLIPVVIGMLRLIQGMANSKPVSFLIMHLIILLLISTIVEAAYSQKMILFKKVRAITMRFHEVERLHEDRIVSEFSLQGKDAIQMYGDGIVLAGIFAAYPVLDHSRSQGSDGGGGCSSCSSCGGGGGGCGGCGGD